MSRRKQKQPKYAQQDLEVMGTDEVSCDDHIKMTEQQSSKNQHAMPTEEHNEANKPKPIELQLGNTEQSTSFNGGDDLSDENHSETTTHDQDSLSSRREAFHGYLKDESQQRNDRKNKSSIGEFQSRNACTTQNKQVASTRGKRHSPDTQTFSEFTCPACGLYFFNSETYEVHVEKYCIALKYLMKNKALEETYLAVHGNDQKKAYKENIDIQHPTLEKLKNAFYRIQQSLSASRNSQINDVSDLFCASQPGQNNNTKESLPAAGESTKHRSGSTTPDMPNRSTRESADDSMNSERHDYRGVSESSDQIGKASKRPTTRCVVCDEYFASESTLRQHVLSKHGSNSNADCYPNVGMNSSMRPYRNNSKLAKSRRFSTVERPVLSLLKARNRVLPGMAEEDEPSVSSPKDSDATGNETPHGSYSSRPNSRGNSSTHTKLERPELPPSNFTMRHFHEDDRRMSCPAAPSVKIALDSYPFLTDNNEQKHCAECDIKFNSIVNYRAHKKFYCAGRHEQRNGDSNPYRSNSIQHPENSQVGYLSPDYNRQSSRSFSNRTNVPSRKRSHFIPLTSSTECNNEEATDDEPRPKKSDSKSPNIVNQPLQNDNEATPQKRYYCEECKISFSKEDTFIAHKKYYCHTRRKDRSSTRSSVTRNPLRKSSRDSAEGLPSYDRATAFNPFSVTENMWRLRDGDRSPSLGSMFPADNFLANAGCNLSQLFQQQQSLVMGNLAMMHPYLMKQYLALREKLPPEIPRTTSNSPNTYLSAFSNNTRKLSADESRLRTHDGYSSTPDLSMKSSRRPARQSCAAAICVKQEDNAWDEAKSGYYQQQKEKTTVETGFPLDLRRNTPCSSGDDDHDRPPSSAEPTTSQTAKGQQSPNKTVDVESDSEGQNLTINNSNNGNDGEETTRPASPKGRGQTCRNCNAEFNSLSTFIAHKKYYCSGISASLQSFSPNPVVVKSESNWGL